MRPLAPFLRGEGWGEGQPHGQCLISNVTQATQLIS
ncbi:Peptidase U61 LD-carboxypeptidase A (fragment) [Bradyrhizobium sp. ORS 375]